MAPIIGNKCGHVKVFWQCPVQHKTRYGTLEYAAQQVEKFFYHPRFIFDKDKQTRYLGWLHGLNKRRIKNAQRRLAIVNVCKVILHYLDMDTLKLAVNNNGSYWLPTLQWIADAAGMGLKRVQRAVRDLARAGYIKIAYRWTQRPDGSYQNKAALRQIRPSFFHHLGVTNLQLDTDQHRARKKHIKSPVKIAFPKGIPVVNHANAREVLLKILGKNKPPDKKAPVF